MRCAGLWRDWPAPHSGENTWQSGASSDPATGRRLAGCGAMVVRLRSLRIRRGKFFILAGEISCGPFQSHVIRRQRLSPLEPTASSTLPALMVGSRLAMAASLGDGLHIRALTVRNNGDVYAVTQDELWLIRATGEKIRLDEGLKGASGVALSPDGLWLFVAQESFAERAQLSGSLRWHRRCTGTVLRL